MRALITGITGFAGSHLADLLLAEHPGIEVTGTHRPGSPDDNLAGARSRVEVYETEMCDRGSVRRAVEAARPDLVFHLAAQTFVPASLEDPSETLTTNLLGQTHLFEAARALKLDPVIQTACSSEEYGLVLKDEVD